MFDRDLHTPMAEISIPKLPRVGVVQFGGRGHMAAGTDPAVLNAKIGYFLSVALRSPKR